ncbi:hypothetical protein FOY51_23785 [Antrihabitans cavernicola]|uniref:Uncharacterized protein n=1 Tax=Antrihabitans cavernicola TaxID=2495913 RepID=A0A5A7S8J5_9NOCA|nr:hypothetical protein FOY51_23785 [Spelaeibacter cavernicola]
MPPSLAAGSLLPPAPPPPPATAINSAPWVEWVPHRLPVDFTAVEPPPPAPELPRLIPPGAVP